MDRTKLNTITYIVVWCYVLYSVGALFFYFSKLFYDVLVPAHLAATVLTFTLFYNWRKHIASEDEDRKSGLFTRFLIPIVGVYMVIYFMMFSRLV